MNRKTIVAALAGVGLIATVGIAAYAASKQDPAAAEIETAPGKTTASEAQAVAKPAPVGNDPEVTTAAYGDWVLQCQNAGAELGRVCEVVQTVNVEGQQGPLAQIAVGRAPKESSYRFTIVVPVNVGLEGPGRVIIGDKTDSPMELPWVRCMPGGCFASAPLGSDDLSQLLASSAKAGIQWVAANGQSISFPISLRGFPQAFNKLKG